MKLITPIKINLFQLFIVCFVVSPSSINAAISLNELMDDQEVTYSDLDNFNSSLDEGNSFYALHLNGKNNFPFQISSKTAPTEIVDLDKLSTKSTITMEHIEEKYPSLTKQYSVYIDEDLAGNRYLYILDASMNKETINPKKQEQSQSQGLSFNKWMLLIGVVVLAIGIYVLYKKYILPGRSPKRQTKTKPVPPVNHQYHQIPPVPPDYQYLLLLLY